MTGSQSSKYQLSGSQFSKTLFNVLISDHYDQDGQIWSPGQNTDGESTNWAKYTVFLNYIFDISYNSNPLHASQF